MSGFLDEMAQLLRMEPAQQPDLERAAACAGIVVDLYRAGSTAGFEELFERVEHHVIFAEPEEQQIVIVGFLENLKNISTGIDLDYAVFEEWLGPETHVAWRWLEKKWQGKSSLASAA